MRKPGISRHEEKLQQKDLACKHIPLTLIPKNPYSLFCAVSLEPHQLITQSKSQMAATAMGGVRVIRGRTINRINMSSLLFYLVQKHLILIFKLLSSHPTTLYRLSEVSSPVSHILIWTLNQISPLVPVLHHIYFYFVRLKRSKNTLVKTSNAEKWQRNSNLHGTTLLHLTYLFFPRIRPCIFATVGCFCRSLQTNSATYKYSSTAPDLFSHRSLLICYCTITVFNSSKVNRQLQRGGLMLTLSQLECERPLLQLSTHCEWEYWTHFISSSILQTDSLLWLHLRKSKMAKVLSDSG